MNDSQTPANSPPEAFRSFLLLLARLQLDAGTANRIEPSDIVQQTLLEAHAKAAQFQGSDAALLAWLRQALINNIQDARRALRRAKRDIRKEQPLDDGIERSTSGVIWLLSSGGSSPSQRAVRNEDLVQLANALSQLPTAQREAVILHHLQEHSLAETAQRLGRTDAAVAGLLHRGLKTLRELLHSGG